MEVRGNRRPPPLWNLFLLALICNGVFQLQVTTSVSVILLMIKALLHGLLLYHTSPTHQHVTVAVFDSSLDPPTLIFPGYFVCTYHII